MRGLIIATLLAGLACGPAAAQTELRTSSAFGPNHVNAVGYSVFLDRLKELTGGAYSGRDFPAGLLSPGEMVSGLQTGIVDVGSVLVPYFPAEFVDSNLPAEMSMSGKNALAVSAAAAEYTVTCPECLAEFSRVDEVFLAGTATPPYQILSVVPIREASDLKGVRIRTGGSAFTRWAEAMGAVPVQLPAPEIFEAMSQGVVQAHYNTLQDLKSYNLFDIVKSVTLIDLGTFNGVSPFSMRLDLWQTLSPEMRHAFIEAAQDGTAALLFRYQEEADKALAKARADGITILEPSPSLAQANADFVTRDTAALAGLLEKKGIRDAAAKIARFQGLVQKWSGLVADVETRDAYVDLLMREIWDKVDLARYPG